MRLTRKQFATLRPIQWTGRVSTNDGRLYYTAVDSTYTRLFNMDLLRKIIAPAMRKQYGVVRLNDFDVDRPVVMRTDLELEMPDDVETLMYLAQSAQSVPKLYDCGLNARTVLAIAFVAFVTLLSLMVYAMTRAHWRRRPPAAAPKWWVSALAYRVV